MGQVRTVYIADSEPKPSLPELSLVRTLVELVEDGVRIPAGTVGTIVLAVAERDGFEIEFDEPVQAVVGAARSEIEPV